MRPAPLPAVTVGVVALAGCDAPAPAMDAPPAAPPAVTAPGPVAGDPVADAALGVDIAVEALLERTAPAIDEQRNVFQFGPPAGGGRAASVAAAPAASGGAVPGSGEPPGATGATPSPPAPDRVDPMRFIGVVEARNRVGRVTVLTDGDGVYHGLVDDIVKGRYRILAIDATSVDVEDMARGSRMTLRLSEA